MRIEITLVVLCLLGVKPKLSREDIFKCLEDSNLEVKVPQAITACVDKPRRKKRDIKVSGMDKKQHHCLQVKTVIEKFTNEADMWKCIWSTMGWFDEDSKPVKEVIEKDIHSLDPLIISYYKNYSLDRCGKDFIALAKKCHYDGDASIWYIAFNFCTEMLFVKGCTKFLP